MSPRRELATVVVLCAAGAALVLYLSSLTWAVEVVVRPAPLPDDRRELTGAALAPWLPALGWVALAGAGALLATSGRWRQAVGVLLSAVGLGVTVGGAWGASQPGTVASWPVLAALGGLVVAAQGVIVLRRSRGWPAMGARYERAPAGGRSQPPAGGPPRTGTGADDEPPAPEEIWDALDRGEDPTA